MINVTVRRSEFIVDMGGRGYLVTVEANGVANFLPLYGQAALQETANEEIKQISQAIANFLSAGAAVLAPVPGPIVPASKSPLILVGGKRK